MVRIRSMILLIVATAVMGAAITAGAIYRSGAPQNVIDAHLKALEHAGG